MLNDRPAEFAIAIRGPVDEFNDDELGLANTNCIRGRHVKPGNWFFNFVRKPSPRLF